MEFGLKSSLKEDQFQDKKNKDLPFWKKVLIIGSVIGFLVIIIIIIIIVAVTSDDKKDNENNENKSDEPDDSDIKELGEIRCQYSIEDISKPTPILGFEYDKKDSNFDIYIGDKKISYTKEYKFEKTGEQQIKFKLYSKINMNNMFKDVSSLTSVFMETDKDVHITSMISTFEDCVNLNELFIRGFNTEELVSMNRFLYGTSPPIINLNSFSTAKIEDMSYMFSGISSAGLDISKIDTSNAKNMSYMFYKNTGVGSLDLSHFDTKKVEDMSHMFESCESLQSINLVNLDTSKVTNMNSMFLDCMSLNDVDLSSFNTELVTDMSHMFDDCSSLKTLNLFNFGICQECLIILHHFMN